MEAALVRALIEAGVGACFALVILVGLYRLAGRLGGRFIEAQQDQASARRLDRFRAHVRAVEWWS